MTSPGVALTILQSTGAANLSPDERAANELKRLSLDIRFSPRRADLADLSDAVRGHESVFSPWTGINLFAAFPPASTIRVARESTLDATLALLAAISVFFPIAWTWWSLQDATRAYSEMLADDSAAGQSFLQLWTTGFDGRLRDIHYLAPVAMVSVVLIVVAVGLIIAHRVVDTRANRREEHDNALAEAELAAALTAAERVLIPRRSENPQDLQRVILQSAERLDQANHETAAAAHQLHTAAESASRAIQSATNGLTQALQEAASVAQDMQGSAQTMRDATVHTESVITSALTGFGTGVQKAVVDFQAANAAAAAATTGQLQQAMAGLQSTAIAAGAAQKSVADSVQKLTDALATFEADIGRSATTATAGLVTSFESSQTKLETQISEVAAVLSRLDEALLGSQSAAQAQTTELTQARDAAERLLRHLESRTRQQTGARP